MKVEYKGKVYYHPGYYLRKIIVHSGLTVEDFAYRLAIDESILNQILIEKENISVEIAIYLSRLFGCSKEYWLDLQKEYDLALAYNKLDEDLIKEKEILQYIEYDQFVLKYELKAEDDVNKQIKNLREFFNISSLTVLKTGDVNSISLNVDRFIKQNEIMEFYSDIDL